MCCGHSTHTPIIASTFLFKKLQIISDLDLSGPVKFGERFLPLFTFLAFTFESQRLLFFYIQMYFFCSGFPGPARSDPGHFVPA
jgi:hypothetical protein